jgi:hypothetical protein
MGGNGALADGQAACAGAGDHLQVEIEPVAQPGERDGRQRTRAVDQVATVVVGQPRRDGAISSAVSAMPARYL